MSCPAITLSGITPEKYQALLATAKAQGLDLTGVSGTTQYQGMTFTWDYDAADESLTIRCTEKPFFIPCSMIDERIKALVA
jgi:hypothetical protein